MEIILQRFGRIPDESIEEIKTTMEDCYLRLGPHELEIVDVIVFEDSSRMAAHASQEQNAFGIQSSGLDEEFVATHEAWTGIPRIMICYERLREFNALLRKAVLRHEVAHSVLHGSPEYYIFAVPRSLAEATQEYGLPRTVAVNTLYLISIGVKDYEATKFLLDHEFTEDQIAYSLQFSKTSKEDRDAWNLSKSDPKKEMLCLVSRFKDLACFAAASSYQGRRDAEGENFKKDLEYLPESLRKRLIETSLALTEMEGCNTFAKVELAADLIVSRLMDYIFSAEHIKNKR